MKAFITGSTGYIGYQLLRYLVKEDVEVNALVRQVPRESIFSNPGVKTILGDLSDTQALMKGMEGCDFVFHLAAYARPWSKDPQTYYNINVEGTERMLRAALVSQVKNFVFASSCAAIGRSNGQPINEEHLRDIDFCTSYESSKFVAENRVQQFNQLGLKTVTIATSKVYGPGQWTESNAVSRLIHAYLEGNWHWMPGNGQMVGCYCFIDDVVDGIWRAATMGGAGEKYILGGENVSVYSFFKMLNSISGKQFLLIKVPKPVLMLYGLKEELGASLFGVEPLITRKWINRYHFDLACSSEKAIRALGYRITPLEEGLKETINWIKEVRHFYW